ncbi:MAG TPA: hypothetical protein VFZ36_08905 [Vicinamibacterales bacterium]
MPFLPIAFHDQVEVSGVLAHQELLAPARAAVLAERDLIALGGDLERTIEVASAAAGAFVGSRHVRTDGMPSAGPGHQAAGSVAVRTDPFSVESGGVDRIDIDVDLAAPSRRWSFRAAPPVARSGSVDPLTGRAPVTRRVSALVAGPGPFAGMTFFTQAEGFTQREEPATATTASGGVTMKTRAQSVAAGVSVATSAALFRATVFSLESSTTNAGLGWLATSDAAFDIDSRSAQVSVAWDRTGRLRQRGGVSVRRVQRRSDARDHAPAVISADLVVSGVEHQSVRSAEHGWVARHVVHPVDELWLAGVEIARDRLVEARTFHPSGVRRSGTDGSVSVLMRTALDDVEVGSAMASVFGQRVWLFGSRAAVRAGVRGDWRHGEGLFVSPRLSAGVRAGGFTFAGAAKLAVDEWSGVSLAALGWRERAHAMWSVDGRPLLLDVGEAFRRRRDLVARAGVARRIGPLRMSLEQTLTHGWHLAGSVRSARDGALVDTLDSGRGLRRHQTHLAVHASAGAWSIASHYEWAHARDNTDGWLALPASQMRPLDEWGPSAGIARHQASLVATGRLWGALQAIGVLRAASGLPYDVLSGVDREGLATYSDRGGAHRNDRTLPGWTNVSVYLTKGIALRRLSSTVVDVSLAAENVFDTPRVDEVGRVMGTAMFGRVLRAGAGRAFSVRLSLARSRQ